MTDPLSIEIDEMEQDLKGDICTLIESQNLQSFSTSQLCDFKEIKEKALLIVNKCKERQNTSKTGKSRESGTSESIKKTLQPILKSLEKEGIIYPERSFGGYFEVQFNLCSTRSRLRLHKEFLDVCFCCT